jgi:hypothetical protein
MILSQTKVDERDLGRCATIDLLQQFDELDLPLALAADANDLSAAGIEASEQVERAGASVFVLDVDRNAARQRRSIGRRPRTWLDGGFLVERKNPLVGPQGSSQTAITPFDWALHPDPQLARRLHALMRAGITPRAAPGSIV